MRWLGPRFLYGQFIPHTIDFVEISVLLSCLFVFMFPACCLAHGVSARCIFLLDIKHTTLAGEYYNIA